MHSLSALRDVLARPFWPEAWGWGQYRPVTSTVVALEWVLGGGAPWVYHAVSIAGHVAACLLLWRALKTLVSPVGATVGVLWFALQPVHVEAVSSAVGQSELLSAVFVLAAWLAHRRGGRLAALWFALALLAKESGIVFVGLALAHDLMLDGGRPAVARRRSLYLRYGVVVALYAAFLATIFSDQSIRVVAQTWTGVSTGARLLTMLSVARDYARLLVAPFVLRTNYEPQVIALQTTLTPAVMCGAALVVAAVAAAWFARRRAPVVAYGIVWFLIAIAPIANVFFATGVVLAERTMYLPSIGAAIVVAWLATRVQWRRLAPALAAIVAVTFGVRVWTRTSVWHDDLALTKSAMHDSPRSYKAHHAAGMMLASAGHWPEAADEYRLARRLFPLDGDPYRGGAEAAMVAHDYTTAAVLLDSARRLGPTQVDPWLRLADVRMLQGRWREAGALAFAAYEIQPDSVRAIAVVADAAIRSDEVGAAQAALRRGLADHPGDASLRRAYAYTVTLQHPVTSR